MREILFRGKRVDNDEWVEGNYILQNDSDEQRGNYMIPYIKLRNYVNKYTVIPETVGQYTGLTDKNGKKIFEGDILAFSDRLVKVVWHIYCGCWDCSYIKSIEGKKTSREDRSPDMWKRNSVIIGNIHDNPELLKGR